MAFPHDNGTLLNIMLRVVCGDRRRTGVMAIYYVGDSRAMYRDVRAVSMRSISLADGQDRTGQVFQ